MSTANLHRGLPLQLSVQTAEFGPVNFATFTSIHDDEIQRSHWECDNVKSLIESFYIPTAERCILFVQKYQGFQRASRSSKASDNPGLLIQRDAPIRMTKGLFHEYKAHLQNIVSIVENCSRVDWDQGEQAIRNLVWLRQLLGRIHAQRNRDGAEMIQAQLKQMDRWVERNINNVEFMMQLSEYNVEVRVSFSGDGEVLLLIMACMLSIRRLGFTRSEGRLPRYS
jgi:hypothetical protein